MGIWEQNEWEQEDGTESSGHRAQRAATADRQISAASLRFAPISLTQTLTGILPTAAVESFSRNSHLSSETFFQNTGSLTDD